MTTRSASTTTTQTSTENCLRRYSSAALFAAGRSHKIKPVLGAMARWCAWSPSQYGGHPVLRWSSASGAPAAELWHDQAHQHQPLLPLPDDDPGEQLLPRSRLSEQTPEITYAQIPPRSSGGNPWRPRAHGTPGPSPKPISPFVPWRGLGQHATR